MERLAEDSIVVGISACLLGQPVRFDGGHKRAEFCERELGQYFSFVPICPEMAIGLGVPRPSIRLVQRADGIHVESGDGTQDVTVPLQAYAEHLGITPGQLTRLCREVLGHSSLEVINARIVHEAQRELVYTRSSIKQVADHLGFVDEAYFTRFFRKHTSQTPREFRTRTLAAMAPGGAGESP